MGADGPHSLQEARSPVPLGFRLGRPHPTPNLRGARPASLLLAALQLSPHKCVRMPMRLLTPLPPRPRFCARVPCRLLCDSVTSRSLGVRVKAGGARWVRVWSGGASPDERPAPRGAVVPDPRV